MTREDSTSGDAQVSDIIVVLCLVRWVLHQGCVCMCVQWSLLVIWADDPLVFHSFKKKSFNTKGLAAKSPTVSELLHNLRHFIQSGHIRVYFFYQS